MESLLVGPMSANEYLIPKLIIVLTFPRNMTFNQTTWNILVRIRISVDRLFSFSLGGQPCLKQCIHC